MIDEPYLNVIMIPTYVDGDGNRYVDELWHKDLVRHLGPIREMTLASPMRRAGSDPTPQFLIDPATLQGTLKFVDLPESRSMGSAIRTLPRTISALWKAVGESEVVHIGVGGYPFSYGWFAAPMAKLRGKFLVTVVESAAWRLGWHRPIRPKTLVMGVITEVVGRVCVNLSDLVSATQSAYLREMLLPWRRHRGVVHSASWIDASVILSNDQAEADWTAKLADPDRPIKVVFAARLTRAKGTIVLLDALKSLERRGIGVDATIYGEGDLLDECKAVAASLTGPVKLTMGGLLAYGPPFFAMVRDQDAVLLPSITDEQPRLVFDCFSQAVPVIASDTTGLRECVTESKDGWFVTPGNPEALADAIERASRNRHELRRMGIDSLDVARGLTHDQMHARRVAVVEAALRRKLDRRRTPAPIG